MVLEVPKRVRKPEFYKGLLVAANVKREEDSDVPLFGEVDGDQVIYMQRNRMCQMCGYKIAKKDWAVFPGNYDLVKYQEAPLHVECARYSMQVCPMILAKQDEFGFAVCKTYEYIECEAPFWHDPGCIPTYGTLTGMQKEHLISAHDLVNVDGHWGCSRCPGNGRQDAGRMTYSEFMEWSK